MAVIKVYTRINWLNKSESLTTPLGKTNLNKMDKAINLIDDEVVSMSAKIDEIDTTKVSADQLNNMVTDVSFNDKNGVISITKHNGTVLNIDTAMEKIAVNFEYNAQTQQLILTLENGEKQYIDMSALITQYEFKDTDTIAFSVDSDGKVSASIKSGSITKAMLSSEVMSAITLSENNAAASAQAAAQSATNAELDAKLSQSYSVGKSGIRDDEDTDNSKYYCNLAEAHKDNATTSEQNAKASEANASTYASNAKASETNAKTYMSNASTYAITASEKAIESSNFAEDASNYLSSINIKSIEIKQIENDVTQMKADVSSMKSDVTLMQEKVAQDKSDIDQTIKGSLLEKSEEILVAMKDYYDRAQELYSSMYIDCDGETPQQRVVTIVSIDCGTPQSRLHDDNGILFDGGTPLSRQLAS